MMDISGQKWLLKDIDSAQRFGRKRLTAWESARVSMFRERLDRDIDLSDRQLDELLTIHRRMTDIVRSRS